MAIKSINRGWECESCKINRNTVEEIHKDCVCTNELKMGLVEESNDKYWENFWNR